MAIVVKIERGTKKEIKPQVEEPKKPEVIEAKTTSVDGTVYLTDGRKIIEATAENSKIKKFNWCFYLPCGNIPMKLLPDGSAVKDCPDCSSIQRCNKPFGRWTWSKEKPKL